ISGPVEGQRDRPAEAFRGPCHQGLHPGRIRFLLPAAMGKKSKAGKAKAEPAASEPSPEQEIPISPAPLPLERLDARALGEFLELCFADRRLLELCGELRLYSPGYRLEAMPPNQVARLLADEAREAEEAERTCRSCERSWRRRARAASGRRRSGNRCESSWRLRGRTSPSARRPSPTCGRSCRRCAPS